MLHVGVEGDGEVVVELEGISAVAQEVVDASAAEPAGFVGGFAEGPEFKAESGGPVAVRTFAHAGKPPGE
jgi:hypothetical protein